MHLGALFAVIAGIMWGFMGIIVRRLYDEGFDATQMVFIRYLIVFITFAIFIMIKNHGFPRVTWLQLGNLAVMGIVGSALSSVFLFIAPGHISLSLTTVLQNTAPFIIVAASIPLFKEKLTRSKLIALLCAGLGCVLCSGILLDDSPADMYGVMLGLISGLCYSTYSLCSKGASDHGIDSPTIMLYSSMFCVIVLAPFSDLGSTIPRMFDSAYIIMLVLGLGFLITLIPFTLFNMSIKMMGAGRASILSYMEPLSATIVGFFAYNENVTPGIALGMFLILLSVVILGRGPTHERRSEEAPARRQNHIPGDFRHG